MTLQAEVDEQRRSIRTDGYPMSIGELVSMYKDRELELHPEFQRYFRWTGAQKRQTHRVASSWHSHSIVLRASTV